MGYERANPEIGSVLLVNGIALTPLAPAYFATFTADGEPSAMLSLMGTVTSHAGECSNDHDHDHEHGERVNHSMLTVDQLAVIVASIHLVAEGWGVRVLLDAKADQHRAGIVANGGVGEVHFGPK